MQSYRDIDRLTKEVMERANENRPYLPIMAVDECLNDPITIKCVHELCSKGLVSGADPLWNQIRVREDGSIFYVLGGVSKNLELPFDAGKP